MQVSTRFSILALMAFAACSPEPENLDELPQAVRVQEVRIGPIVQGRTHLAEVIPAQTVRILAQVPGTIAEIGAQEGVPTPQGTLVARISAPDVAARRSRVRAERRRAERERDFACAVVETDRVLAASGDLSTFQLDRSEKGCESASLMVEAAQAAEREASVAGTKSTETTPFEGQVLTYLVDVGQTVMPGVPLAQFGSQERQLRLRVVASDLADIREGTRVVTHAGDGRAVEIGGQAQGPGRLYAVTVALDHPLDLRIGETLSATLVVAERLDGSAVPDSALGDDGEGNYVLVEQGSRVRRVEVTTGPRDQGWVAVSPELPAGTRVVTSNIAGLDTSRPVMAVMP